MLHCTYWPLISEIVMEVVSIEDIKPVVKRVNFTTALPGSTWGPRLIFDFELIYVVKGHFEYSIGENTTPFNPGDVLVIYPCLEHTVRKIDDGQRELWSCIHCEPSNKGAWVEGDYQLAIEPAYMTHTPSGGGLVDMFRQAARAFAGQGRYRNEIVSSLVRSIWLRLAEQWVDGGASQLSGRMEKMTEYLREHLGDPVSRLDLARKFELTPQHVNALFRKELGITPGEFLQRERVRHAAFLLKDEGMSVRDASAAVGFCDQFYFSRVFKSIIGVSPSQV